MKMPKKLKGALLRSITVTFAFPLFLSSVDLLQGVGILETGWLLKVVGWLIYVGFAAWQGWSAYVGLVRDGTFYDESDW